MAAFDFDTLFYTDYNGIRWTDATAPLTVTWSIVNTTLELAYPRGATAEAVEDARAYLDIFSKAFDLWDAALTSVSFQMTQDGNAADVALAVTAIDGPGGVDGWWAASWRGGLFTEATIQFDPFGIAHGDLLTTALHEVGNILGLGDIRPTMNLRSVMKDPFPEPFSGDALWADDVAMIRSYYGETLTSSGLRVTLATSDGTALDGVVVSVLPEGGPAQGAVLSVSGQVVLDLGGATSGRITATRDHMTGDPAITALDALDVLRLAVGIAPSFGPAQAQNYIAADINTDGAVTALDALEVLRAAVGIDSANAPRWAFFDADTDWGVVEASRASVNAPETGIDLSAVATEAELTMTGILLGNMEDL